MKKIVALLFSAVMLASLLSVSAFAQAESAHQLYHVTDAADILSERETEDLEAMATQVSEEYSCGVYIITLDDYRNYTDGSVEDCSEALYNYYSLGIGAESNGILLLMSMDDRDFDLCAKGSLAHASFTDYGKGELEDMFLDDFRNNDWYGGFQDYISGCGELLGMQQAGQPLDVPGYNGGNDELDPAVKLIIVIALPCVVALVVCLIFLFQMRSAHIKVEAGDYVVPNSLRLRVRDDRFTHRTEVRHVIEQNRSGGGGTSINSGGFSHSSGKF